MEWNIQSQMLEHVMKYHHKQYIQWKYELRIMSCWQQWNIKAYLRVWVQWFSDIFFKLSHGFNDLNSIVLCFDFNATINCPDKTWQRIMPTYSMMAIFVLKAYLWVFVLFGQGYHGDVAWLQYLANLYIPFLLFHLYLSYMSLWYKYLYAICWEQWILEPNFSKSLSFLQFCYSRMDSKPVHGLGWISRDSYWIVLYLLLRLVFQFTKR